MAAMTCDGGDGFNPYFIELLIASEQQQSYTPLKYILCGVFEGGSSSVVVA
jgi:hypothetical protein